MIEKIELHRKHSDPDNIFSRASFLTNNCYVSKILCSFQIAMGYSPSILGFPRMQVRDDIMKYHIRLTATSALHKLMKTRKPNTLSKTMLKPGRKFTSSLKARVIKNRFVGKKQKWSGQKNISLDAEGILLDEKL